MQDVAIVLRGSRAVISCAIQTPRGSGWHCAENWRELEGLALEVISHTMTDGPFVYRCPPQIAVLASFADLPLPTPPSAAAGQVVQVPLFGMEVQV